MTHDTAQFERDRVRQLLRARLFGAEAVPTRLGRFEVRGRIGQGATGVVYRAYDPELSRDVALKLLGGAPGKRLMARLSAEGRALAKLSHPNVVQIHDVGEHDGEVFLAMQLVVGDDLRTWLSRGRSEAEIVEALIGAARGLAAAHREGMVHRDFKPENVLVGEHAVLVADFGLAALTVEAEGPAGPASALGTTPAGTPAYMAPEQWAQGPVDARADQYAFGLVLLEALTRSRAPLGDREPPSPARIAEVLARAPRAYRAIVRRALAPTPDARFESMEAASAALASAREGTRRRRALVAVGSVGAVALAVALALTTATEPCPDPSERWEGVWDAARSERVRSAFDATGLPFARRAFETTREALDAYRRDWLGAHRDVCEATLVLHEQSEPLRDARMTCLEEGRRAALAAVALLEDADDAAVIRAARVVGDLPGPEACVVVGLDEVPAVVPPEAARNALASARASLSAGRYAEGLTAAEAARSALGDAPALSAEAELLVGRLQHESGDYAAAEASLVRAMATALVAPAPRVTAASAVSLVETYAVGASRYAEAERWSVLAEAHLAGLDDTARLRADLMLARGELYRNQYRRADAIAALEEAVALHREAYGEASPRLAAAMTRLGMAMYDADGCALIEEARLLRERTLGEGHPDLADSYDRLASCAMQADDPGRAGELHARALALRRAVLGPDHRDVARSCFNFAWLRLTEERLEESEELYECAHRIYRGAGNRHFEAAALVGLADVRLRQRRLEDAAELLSSAGAIYRETVPREHGSVARLETQLGRLSLLRGDAAAALTHYVEAVRISRATDEREVEGLGLEGAGRAELALGHVPEAEAHFAAARALGSGGLTPALLRFRMAQALLLRSPTALGEARAEARAARDEIAGSPAAWAAVALLAEIDAWLADAAAPVGIGRAIGSGDGYGASRR